MQEFDSEKKKIKINEKIYGNNYSKIQFDNNKE